MMTEKLETIARPYALAAFEFALENNALASWEAILKNATLIAENKDMMRLMNSPQVTRAELFEFFCDVLTKTKELDNDKKNFIHLLAEYERLVALPEIAALFTQYRAQYEKTLSVSLISAKNLDGTQQQKFKDALTRRLKRKIELHCEVDESLLGGALIRAGDMVIDGSIRGKLNRLIEFI